VSLCQERRLRTGILVVLLIAIFSFIILYRTSTTGDFVNPYDAKQYIFVKPTIRDTRLLYCPDGLFPEMVGKNLEAIMNSGRKCIPSPYTAEYPYLDEYYCCEPVFSDRYVEELPRHPY
jgi:hypothetical protein